MFCEIFSVYLRLQRWIENPQLPRCGFGVEWWTGPEQENNEPLSEDEVLRLKNFLAVHAPSSYRRLFPAT